MSRGSLRIYVGASPGVGKTYKMLGEGVRRRTRGADVVIGIVETHDRVNTAAQIGDLEMVPLRTVDYRGTQLRELDVDAVLRRAPAVALVDEYAHTNAPGSRNAKRWQDVEQLLDAGIDVVTTVNIQHLESLNDVITTITGITQSETVPDDVVRRADQLELVDMTPEAIRRRLAHGNIYPADRVDAAMANYFRVGNLGALRELALLWLADRVEDSLQSYLSAHGLPGNWETRERVVVGITGRPGGDALIRRASRIAGRAGGELIGVHVAVDDGLNASTPDALAEQRELVVELGGTTHDLVGHDPADALVAFAQRSAATQLVLGASHRTRLQELTRGSFVARTIRLAEGFDVHVIHDEDGGGGQRRGRRRTTRTHGFAPRRVALAWLLTVGGLPALAGLLLPLRADTAFSTVLLIMLSLVLVIAATGGTSVGVVAAITASLLVNWFYVPPYNTLTIAEFEHVVALAVFIGVAITVGSLVVATSRRALEARRARLEAGALARSATSLATDPDPLPTLLDHIRRTFDLSGVRVRGGTEDAAVAAEHAGDVNGNPSMRIALHSASVDNAAELELFGGDLSNDDRQLLDVLADQLAVALDKRRLAAESAEADKLADIDATRTALLRAVSHDLRTPLASIKAMVSGLRDPLVDWQPAQVAEAHVTIEEEADRLTRLVGNLLDASRLQIGAIAIALEPVAVDTVIASVARLVDAPPGSLVIRSDPDAVALTDAALLERSLDNIVRNALRHAPAGVAVVIDTARVRDDIHIRVVDRGPGVPVSNRTAVMQPFQRLDDHGSGSGVGLGLSIAHGFIAAMRGSLTLDDTPGGGLTVTIAVPAADLDDAPEP